MLQELDQVDWRKWTHAYGAATDTPYHLRALASIHADEREAAYYTLADTLAHQGSVYNAAIPAIPFVVELLESPQTNDKFRLLRLLGEFAFGSDSPYEHGFTWIADLRRELRRHVALYLSFVDDANERCREEAIALLRHLPESQKLVLPELRRRFATETNAPIRAILLRVIANWNPAEGAALAASAAKDDPALLTTLVGLVESIRLCDGEPPGALLDQATAIVVGADDGLIGRYDALPMGGQFYDDLCGDFVLKSAPHASQIASHLLSRFREQPLSSPSAAKCLLRAALFGGGIEPDLANLTAPQQEAVTVVARAAWPEADRSRDEFVDILRQARLPTTVKEIATLLPPGALWHLKKPKLGVPRTPKPTAIDAWVRVIPIVLLAIAAAVFLRVRGNVSKTRQNDSPRQTDDHDRGAQIAKQRERVFEVLEKSDNDLTDADRNLLILFGFGKEDDELTDEEESWLDEYGLKEARIRWRRRHESLTKTLP